VGRLEEEEEKKKNEFRGRHFTAADLAAMLSNPWVFFPLLPKRENKRYTSHCLLARNSPEKENARPIPSISNSYGSNCI
jgi:hypothetical protein